MASLLGTVVGGCILVYLLSLVLEWAIFKRVLDSPSTGIPASVGTAVVIGVILFGFGNADGGPWNPWPGGIGYVVAGVLVGIARMLAWRKREAETNGGVAQTFE